MFTLAETRRAETALPQVARSTYLIAHLVPLLTLPSALWRVALVLGLPVADTTPTGTWEIVYILSLSVLTEGLALLTFGLVRRWGEVFPRWVPGLSGRRVPVFAAVLPAGLGATALTLLWGHMFANAFTGDFFAYFGPVQSAVVIGCYAPLIAWGPALAYVTYAYYRRRLAQRY